MIVLWNKQIFDNKDFFKKINSAILFFKIKDVVEICFFQHVLTWHNHSRSVV